MRNLHRRFVLCSNGQIYSGDFTKFRGLPRIYELYLGVHFFSFLASVMYMLLIAYCPNICTVVPGIQLGKENGLTLLLDAEVYDYAFSPQKGEEH